VPLHSCAMRGLGIAARNSGGAAAEACSIGTQLTN
jgi:hypothetical protein